MTRYKTTYDYEVMTDNVSYIVHKRIENIDEGGWVEFTHYFKPHWEYERTSIWTGTILIKVDDEATALKDAMQARKRQRAASNQDVVDAMNNDRWID